MGTSKANDHPSSELDRYIEQIKQIQELSSPRVSSLADEDNYRERLLDNFSRIGSYSKENNRILKQYYYPHILSDERLDWDMVKVLTDFSQKLFSSITISYTDSMLLYRCAQRLLREAEETDNDMLRIRALRFVAASTYHLAYMRFAFKPTIRYRDEGWDAAEAFRSFLDKDLFLKLNSPARQFILNQTAYHLRIFLGVLFDDNSEDPGRKNYALNSLVEMLHLIDDPFYVDQMDEDFDRITKRISILEYIASLTDDNNAPGFEKEELEQIYDYTLELEKTYLDCGLQNAYIEAMSMELPLFLCRNAYLVGRTDESEYKRSLREIFDSYEDFDFSEEMPTVLMNTAREYLLLASKGPVDAVDAAFLSKVYSKFVGYMHQAPKDNLFGYLISDASTILALFIDVPGGMGFEEMCLNTLAALHPPTYIHTLSVASFACCLTRHLIVKMPSLFIGVRGCENEAQVIENAEKIEDFVYHASLCHDFGKLMVAETIMNYGRDLMDEEMEMICFHPVAGARLLEKHEDTAPYVDVALGHHKWYDNSRGYPDTFDIDASPIKNIVAIVACADCLDAATDAVGRSYKDGKSLDHFLDELREGSGIRYAPWLYPLFEDSAIRDQIEHLLTEGRDENYRKAYRILSTLST